MKPRRRGRHETRHRGALAGVALLVLAAGCSTTVIPPASPTEPVTAFLLDHGHTPSLVLPSADSNMTRYVYGDWNWYALRNTGFTDGLRALFWPSQGTLGRRELRGPPEAHIVRERVRADTIQELLPITVSRAAVERLRARLDAEHGAGARVATAEALDIRFVPHPRRYSYFHNSNHAVADWLEELGCEIQGSAFHSRWRVGRRSDPR
jgi:hypothetical protein